MYIKYNREIYELIYCWLVEKKVISTYKKEKTDSSFYEISDYYAKDFNPDDPQIESIYDVKFYVYWDSQLENVEKKWRIETSDYFSSGNVELCHEGYLPGWRVKEKGYSTTQIHPDQIEGYSVEYIYVVKDGKKLEEPLIIEKDVNREEFEKIIDECEEA